ncbi:MAG: sensor histidine kinase [Mariniphaga sp.]
MKIYVVFIFLFILIFKDSIAADGTREHLQQIQFAKPDSNKVILLSNLCWEYRTVSSDSAFLFGTAALQLARNIGYPKGIAQAYNDLGILYIDKSDYKKAAGYLKEAMKIREKMNDLQGMASLFNKLGIIDQKQGRLKEALENQISALTIYRNLGQDKWIGYSLNNIAIIHQNLGNLDKALEYHKMGLEYRLKMKDAVGEANSYSNMANLYAKMRDTTQSLVYYEKAISLARLLKNEELISGNLGNMANIYMGKREFQRAISLFSESLEIRERLGDLKGISSTLSRMGTVYTETGRYRQAQSALTRALAIAGKISVIDEKLSALLALAKLKALTNQPDSAFVLMKIYSATKDSAYDERLHQQILDVQTKYENQKLEQDLQLIKKEKEFDEVTLKQQKTQLWLLVFVLISVTGAGIFLFYRHQQRQKAVVDAEKILQQEARMSAVLQVQEDERRRIAKELHDGLGQTLSAIKLNFQSMTHEAISPDSKADFNKIEKMLDNANVEVRSISHQMMPKELEQFGLVAAVDEMLRINLENTRLKYSFEHNGFTERIGNQTELALFRVLQELVNNVIKHSKADMLNVQIIRHANHVVLNVSDNGIGFDVDRYEKKGIGLLNIASRIDGIKGHLHYESAPGEGTTVIIRASA